MIEIIENTYFCTTDHFYVYDYVSILLLIGHAITLSQKSGLHLKICANTAIP